jgi:hypothetical protein
MANFNKAFQFTAGWEGAWDGGNKLIKFDDSTAAYGITPLFLYESVGMSKSAVTLTFMQSLDFNRASDIWEKSRWAWFKLDSIASDEIAILLFDWSVRRPNICAKNLAIATGFKESDLSKIPYDNSVSKTDNQLVPSYAMIDALNAKCKNKAGKYDAELIKKVYLDLIVRRVKAESNLLDGVKRRIGCLLFGEWTVTVDSYNDLPKARKEQITKGVMKILLKKNQTKSTKKAKSTKNNLLIGGAVLLTLGFIWNKKRKKRQ